MKCLISGCETEAENYLGVRLRYPPKGKAVWAPETKAHLCNIHAFGGLDISITVIPNNSGELKMEISDSKGPPLKRNHKIKKK